MLPRHTLYSSPGQLQVVHQGPAVYAPACKQTLPDLRVMAERGPFPGNERAREDVRVMRQEGQNVCSNLQGQHGDKV